MDAANCDFLMALGSDGIWTAVAVEDRTSPGWWALENEVWHEGEQGRELDVGRE
jgi:hypothetical protein